MLMVEVGRKRSVGLEMGEGIWWSVVRKESRDYDGSEGAPQVVTGYADGSGREERRWKMAGASVGAGLGPRWKEGAEREGSLREEGTGAPTRERFVTRGRNERDVRYERKERCSMQACDDMLKLGDVSHLESNALRVNASMGLAGGGVYKYPGEAGRKARPVPSS